ncbi:MAG: DNA translocase FtsK [Oligoflexia bacterium]|nr:DNA translocase FtsK [Oligoflexia bacterium]
MENRHGSSRLVPQFPGVNAVVQKKKANGFNKTPLAEVSSLITFAFSVFIVFALLTYFPSDPSLFSNNTGPALNACGRVGAYLASLILQAFGMGGFLIPAAFFFIAASVHKREGSIRVIGTLGGMTVAVMSLTVFLSLQWKYWPYSGTLILTGGAFGAWVADLLVNQFNPFGSSLVSLLVFCVALALSTPLSVARMGAAVIRFASVITWRVTRLLGTYLIYLFGLLAMRGAHAAGDFLQRLIEGAIERAKARMAATAAVEAGTRKKQEIMVGSEVVDAGVPRDAKQLKLPNLPDDEDGDGLPGLQDASTPAPMDSHPNALPELEAGMGPAAPVDAAARGEGRPPAILPHEKNPAGAVAGAFMSNGERPAARAAAKLARRAMRRGQWKLPTVEFLRKPPKAESTYDKEKLIANSQILRQKFADFGIDGEVTAVRPGPVITLYEFKPGPGVKVSRIAALADDLSMALSAQSVRILAPLPGKSVVGIEIPSDHRETVFVREFLQHPDFYGSRHSIPVVMGKDIAGQCYLSDLARMPHLLCAGQTGSGKSVFMNGLICSLFYRFTPDELRMILVDPKFIEFRAYQDIPHLLLPVVDDPKHASTALKWAVREMERRYRILAKMGARNLAGFNQKVDELGADVVHDLLLAEENQSESAAPQSGNDWIEAFEPDESGAPRVGKLPYIVIIIDELADLMMVARKEVEVSIARIAQKARAAGIHLVIATQRPSTDVITGLIKANLPSRLSFQLASYVDSKTILDRAGAERLLGQGDMLFIPPGISQVLRLHGALVDDEEIGKITSFLRGQGKPAYRDEILLDTDEEENGDGSGDDEESDELMQEGIELVKRAGHASASFLQRHLKIGYNRAARMIETMEERGIVGPADGARPREVLLR